MSWPVRLTITDLGSALGDRHLDGVNLKITGLFRPLAEARDLLWQAWDILEGLGAAIKIQRLRLSGPSTPLYGEIRFIHMRPTSPVTLPPPSPGGSTLTPCQRLGAPSSRMASRWPSPSSISTVKPATRRTVGPVRPQPPISGGSRNCRSWTRWPVSIRTLSSSARAVAIAWSCNSPMRRVERPSPRRSSNASRLA
jgi:hypothetical protein